ncbi:citrulline utilization hydrolase CtlX [Helicobacter cappadocius]|uniref:Arginine deiminase-related protein n=1 Tax=Helicobacter cappadocius TaxID=3063998 RepID=A0AA90Q312_9HELI|nr:MULTISPECIES: arginine deiminase-related protein [unclassified Helicobacter]MDO7253352.1 arginine deiminase-related protein [Helicobacter sp. faydin-H75]MDP2539218.1 arginine deiminase-related protein [Helicobacter sp. faydin-H76]
MKQVTNKIIMTRPNAFHFNPQTAVNNYFQKQNTHEQNDEIQAKALMEFDSATSVLEKAGIEICYFEDTQIPHTPDSIFPNNWFVSIDKNNLCLCSMFAENRRNERKKFLSKLFEYNHQVKLDILDLSLYEKDNKFLEGTGAMVLDRIHKVAFASLSPRCDKELLYIFCEHYGYKPVAFTSYQNFNLKRLPIYHTNVMMAICSDFAVVCFESIDNVKEREFVIRALENCNKEVIALSENQIYNFAGNIIELENKFGEKFVVMSNNAYHCLEDSQIEKISEYAQIISMDISNIEQYGGGSIRCMIAELFNQSF